jgi:hypothetical protein
VDAGFGGEVAEAALRLVDEDVPRRLDTALLGKVYECLPIRDSPQAAVVAPELTGDAEDELPAGILVEPREAEALELFRKSPAALRKRAAAVTADGEEELGDRRARKIPRKDRLPDALAGRADARSMGREALAFRENELEARRLQEASRASDGAVAGSQRVASCSRR